MRQRYPTMDTTKNAVIYARFSSHSQREESIEGQLRICHEYAKSLGLSIIEEYIDRAVSGTTDNRPDFQRMIDDAKKKQFSYVIVYRLDRFARNRYDSVLYKHKLKQCGVKVVSATEGIGTGDESILLEALIEASAEYYSMELSRKIKRGRHEGAAKGNFLGGIVPLGYKLEGSKLVIDDETAPIVRHIFDRYAAGVRKKQIIDELNEKGYSRRNGKPFTYTAFETMLKNRKYVGDLCQNGITVENGCPAIISLETFNMAQERIALNRRAPARSKAKTEYLLSGKMFCGYCGSAMTGVSGTGRSGEIFNYYSCIGRRKKSGCKKQHEKKDFIEWYVCEQTVHYMLDPKRLSHVAKRIIEIHDAEFDSEKVKKLERAIENCNADIRKLVDALTTIPDAGRSVLYDKIERIGAAKADMEIDLAKLRVLSDVRYKQEDVEAWIRSMCQGDLMDINFRRRLIDVFINSVYLFDDRIVIVYNIKNGKQVSGIEVLNAIEEFDGVSLASYDAMGDKNGSYLNANAPPLRSRSLLRFSLQQNRGTECPDLFYTYLVFNKSIAHCIFKLNFRTIRSRIFLTAVLKDTEQPRVSIIIGPIT